MHTSVTAHIVANWHFNRSGQWEPNLREFASRLGCPAVCEWVDNLYLLYLFTLRAVRLVQHPVPYHTNLLVRVYLQCA